MSGPILFILRILIALALYGFLIWALVNLWRDLRHQSKSLAGKPVPRISLYPETIEDIGPSTFSSFEVLVGRDPNCDIILADSTVSFRHARLVYRQDQWWLEDLRSTNGTFLNDHRVDIPTVITNADRVQFGQSVYLITIDQTLPVVSNRR
jgi:hypothetical protein